VRGLFFSSIYIDAEPSSVFAITIIILYSFDFGPFFFNKLAKQKKRGKNKVNGLENEDFFYFSAIVFWNI
jgi:hypothetical protein